MSATPNFPDDPDHIRRMRWGAERALDFLEDLDDFQSGGEFVCAPHEASLTVEDAYLSGMVDDGVDGLGEEILQAL